MILHDFVVVERPASDVQRTLLDGVEWLAESASSAEASAEHLRVRIGPGGPHALVAKTVELKLGEPVVAEGVTTIPVLWEATGARALFPRLDGSLEVSPLGEAMTQLTLFARYDPPFGKIGAGMDRLVLHHLAEHTVRAFLRDVAQHLRAVPEGNGHRALAAD